jgi:hypothetical protein
MPAARPFPPRRLQDSERLAKGIRESNAGRPMNRVLLAEAVELSPGSSGYRDLISAAYRYGLTEGNYKSENIALTALGQALTAPRSDGERVEARRRAFKTVDIFAQVLAHYSNAKLPSDHFLRNTLEREPFNVDPEWSGGVAEAFRTDAEYVGLLKVVGGQAYVVETDPVDRIDDGDTRGGDDTPEAGSGANEAPLPNETFQPEGHEDLRRPSTNFPANRRVYISHGKNQAIVDQIKEIVQFGKFEPWISVERITVSKPVPQKVMEEMRACFAGVIHVATEEPVATADGVPIRPINQNVLIEIGAALALYGGNVILLVENGTQMPSNLQGLFEVRYSGEKLDGDATMRLLKAFNGFDQTESHG